MILINSNRMDFKDDESKLNCDTYLLLGLLLLNYIFFRRDIN